MVVLCRCNQVLLRSLWRVRRKLSCELVSRAEI